MNQAAKVWENRYYERDEAVKDTLRRLEAAEAELAKRPRPTLAGQLVADNASLNARLEVAEAERDEWKRRLARRVEDCCCEDDGDLMCLWCAEDRAALVGSGDE